MIRQPETELVRGTTAVKTAEGIACQDRICSWRVCREIEAGFTTRVGLHASTTMCWARPYGFCPTLLANPGTTG